MAKLLELESRKEGSGGWEGQGNGEVLVKGSVFVTKDE